MDNARVKKAQQFVDQFGASPREAQIEFLRELSNNKEESGKFVHDPKQYALSHGILLDPRLVSELTRRSLFESIPRPVQSITKPQFLGPVDPNAPPGQDGGPGVIPIGPDEEPGVFVPPDPDNPFGPVNPHAWPAAVAAGAAVVAAAAAVVTAVVTLVRSSHGDELIRVIEDMRVLKGLGEQGITMPSGKQLQMPRGGTFGGLVRQQ